MTVATNERMEIEATAEKAGFDIEEPIITNTAVNVSADTYERLITYTYEETLDSTINRIMNELEVYRRRSNNAKGK